MKIKQREKGPKENKEFRRKSVGVNPGICWGAEAAGKGRKAKSRRKGLRSAGEVKSERALLLRLLHTERYVVIQKTESLILAQDERWRRA